MTPSRVSGICLIVFAYISLISHAAFAQQTSAIAGVVRDGSGGVLPGVTVEAASPALIEKVRTVVTDDQGLAPAPTWASTSRTSGPFGGSR